MRFGYTGAGRVNKNHEGNQTRTRAQDRMLRGISASHLAYRTRALIVSAALLICVAGLSWTAVASNTRTLTFFNIHTKETTTVTYKKDGEFLPEGMKQINYVMRDWRRDEPTEMDPELIDLIWEIYQELGSQEPIHLISGYRSRKTNERLRRRRGGQARNSRHILGKAADIHFPDVSAKKLRNSALVREIGGVGYYPTSALPFVHVDTGRVRHWPRMGRRELAELFPSGKTKHRPRDGRPITIADARAALARLKRQGRTPPVPVSAPVRMVADASNSISAQKTRSDDLLSLTGKADERRPSTIVTAGVGLNSLSLPWLARAGGITGAAPKPEADAPAAPIRLASADPMADITAALPSPAPALPPVTQAEVASAPDYDPEHPEELSYQPFPVLPLMGDTPLAEDRGIAALAPPAYGKARYLLTEPERRIALALKPFTGASKVAAAWEFSGPAVRNLLARSPAPAPAAPAPGPASNGTMTASGSDVPYTASIPSASAGFGGPAFGFTPQ